MLFSLRWMNNMCTVTPFSSSEFPSLRLSFSLALSLSLCVMHWFMIRSFSPWSSIFLIIPPVGQSFARLVLKKSLNGKLQTKPGRYQAWTLTIDRECAWRTTLCGFYAHPTALLNLIQTNRRDCELVNHRSSTNSKTKRESISNGGVAVLGGAQW